VFRPNKLLLFLSLSLAFLLAYPSLFAQEESITMTTYYPSPYGSYREMRAKRMAIGDDYIQGETYSWDSLPPSINADADLVVQGNVGIGTTNPSGLLQVYQTGTGGTVPTAYIYDYVASPGTGKSSLLVKSRGSANTEFIGRFQGNDGSTEAMAITEAGNVGIGTTAPAHELTIGGGTDGKTLSFGEYVIYGGAYSSGASLIGNMVMPVLGSSGYAKSTNITIAQAAIELNTGKISFATKASDASAKGTAWDLAANTKMVISNDGNVGIGKTDPGYKLDVWGSAWNNIARIYSTSGSSGIEVYDTGVRRGVLYSDSSGFGLLSNAAAWAVRVDYGTTNIYIPGSVGIGVSPVVRLDVGGAVHAAGFPVSSDERFKENIVPLTASGSVLAKMQNIRGIYFDWNELYKNLGRARDSKGRQMGIIAQEIKREFPEVVSIWGDGSGYLAVDYSRFTAVLLEGIKELDQRTKGIKTTVSDKRLKKNITYLQKGLDIIERLKPAKFDYIQGEKRQVGFIAQDIEEVLPDTVTKGQDGMLGSKTESIIPYLVMAIQEQQQEIEGLKVELQRLKEKL